MLHNWTIGGSGSGKTALNKLLCAGMRSRGITCAVLDPLRDGGWDADYVTHDPDAYWRWMLRNRDERVALFWEEAGIAVDREDARFKFAATTGRHAGWRLFIISHKLKQIHPTVRAMCKDRWIFNCEADDAQLLFKTYGHPALKELPNLPPLHGFRVRPFKPIERVEIKFDQGGRAKLFLKELPKAAA